MKNLNVKHFILISLFLALIVQVLNTSSLYIGFSHLADPYRTIAGYFIGISAEFSIFICIYAGSRAAGASFAVITFFCGILFHNHWPEVQMNFNEGHFYFPTPFLSSTLLQLMNSVLVWFLSDLFIRKHETEKASDRLETVLMQEVSVKMNIGIMSDRILKAQSEHADIKKAFDQMNIELSEFNHKKETLQQEIITLQKKKATASRGVSE